MQRLSEATERHASHTHLPVAVNSSEMDRYSDLISDHNSTDRSSVKLLSMLLQEALK